jgi:hypothetical protein
VSENGVPENGVPENRVSEDGTIEQIDALDEQTLRPLLLHSLHEIREVWVPLLDLFGVASVTEIGSESGVTTSLLVDRLGRAGGGRLVVVDPDPGLAPESGDDLEVEVIRGFSPQALEGLAGTDAYLIDGDHNYWTVSHELEAVERAAEARATFPLVLLNDVSWPAARRDQYYGPDRLPPEAVHPHSFELGAVLGRSQLGARGFRGMGAFAFALHEGGPRNGVLTAVEDFVAARKHLELHVVAPVFGLGVILDVRSPEIDEARRLLAPYAGSRFLARLERNRIELYLRVLELQDAPVTDRKARQREWARLDEERSALAARELEAMERVAAAERAVADAELRARTAEERAAAAAAAGGGRRPGWLAGRA